MNIQEDLDRAIKWFKENRLHLNVKKTKWSLLGTYQKISKAVDINVGNAPLEQVSEYKYLGMWIDKNLNRNYHVDEMCSKLSKRLGILCRVKFNLPKETLYMLYNSIVLPHFECGDVEFSCSAITLNILQVLQNRGARMLLDCDYRTHSVNMLSELKWLNIKDRLNFHKMCLVHKCRNGLAETFSNVSNKHEHHTRAKTRQNLTLVKPKNNQLK